MKNILLTIALIYSASNSNAQMSNYTFIREGGQISYLDANDTAVKTHMVQDDIVLPAKVAIGFSFNFNGVFYDSVGISENGYIWFGPARANALSSVINPLSSSLPTGVNGIVCAFGLDLHPHTQTSLTTSIRSKTIFFAGQANDFVVEWRNTSRIDALNDVAGEDTIGFQIQLFRFELYRVQITYGYDIGLNPNISSNISVGIRGGNNSEFHVRSTDDTHNWNNNFTGSSINATCKFDRQNNPGHATFNYMSWLNNGNTSGIHETMENISIYPVPANDQILVKSEQDFHYYEIIGSNGKAYQGGTFKNELDISTLPSGVYLLRLLSDKSVAYKRIVKL